MAVNGPVALLLRSNVRRARTPAAALARSASRLERDDGYGTYASICEVADVAEQALGTTA